jgi:hypothetical protein
MEAHRRIIPGIFGERIGNVDRLSLFRHTRARRQLALLHGFDSECAAVEQLAGWIFEANAFYIAADIAQCPASTRPVYRLYNNSVGGEPNHRYTTRWPVISDMQSEGWLLEGVVFCAPL